jgi:hypothetical protein
VPLVVDIPSALLVAHARELYLHAVDTVDAVNEQDQDEDERDLVAGQHSPISC